MIPFEDMDARLSAIGQDRAWLAQTTPYSPDYIRTVLAPKSTRRTQRVQAVLSNAIEKEEQAQAAAKVESIDPPDRITIYEAPEQFDAWSRSAAAEDPPKTVKECAIETLNQAAEEWHHRQKESKGSALRVAEPEPPYQAANQGK